MSVPDLAIHAVTRIKVKRELVRNHDRCRDHDIVRITIYERMTVNGMEGERALTKLTLYGAPGEPTFEGDLVLK